MDSYDVVVTGFSAGSNPAEAKLRLAQIFKAAPEQIEQLCSNLPYTGRIQF